MTTETFLGLHSCKPGNEPVVGQIKTFTVEHRPAVGQKKAWTKIKSASQEQGGAPYRILKAEPTGYTDSYGNVSFNIEIESSGGGERETNGVPTRQKPISGFSTTGRDDPPPDSSNGVDEARKHLMRSCNLYNLCISAVEKAIHLPENARTGEQYQATLASIWIEASSRRSDDGIKWWSYIDLMPDKPIK